MADPAIQERLEYLRGEIEAERISYGEIAELQSLVEHIDPDDMLLLEWAGQGEQTMSTNKHPNAIVVTVEGGVIQSVDNIPPGQEVVVMDFDTEGVPDEETRENDLGQRYVESVWQSDQ